MKPLNERKLILFQNLMTLYLKEGRPVGSAHLTDALNLSSATIRNAMADLEKMGLLYSPHTSAGRVPTEQGLRFFVDTLLHIAPENYNAQLAEGVRQQLQPAQSQDEALSRAADVISNLTGLAGVVMLPNKAEERLKHIEFVPLNENRVLVVVLFNGQDIQNRMIELEKPASASQLQEISNYLNRHFAGFTLKEVQQQIVRQMKQLQQTLNQTMQQMMRVTEQVLSDQLNLAEPYIISGKTKLLNYQELADAEKLKALFEAFEEHSTVLNLLDKSLQQRGLQIFIGRECGADAYADCSVVTSPYEIESELMGVLGVVGPSRMPYEQVASRVMITAKTLTQILR